VIRALHVINSLEIGGAETLVLRLCRKLRDVGVEPSVATVLNPGGLADQFTDSGIPLLDLSRGGRFDPISAFKLSQHLVAGGIDIVHTHLVHAGVVGKIAALTAGIPVVTTRHYTADAKSEHWDFLAEDRLTRSVADRVIAIGDRVRTRVLDLGIATSERLVVHPNAIDVDTFDVPTRDVSRTATVGTIGRMHPAKAHDVFLRAMAEVVRRKPDVNGTLVGDGELRDEMLTLRHELNLEANVELPGAVDFQNIGACLADIDIFALSSAWEGLPMVLLEAAASGLPLVATEVGGVPEVVIHEETGLLVPPSDPVGLADAICRLVDDTDLRITLGRNARRFVEQHFDVGRLAKQTAALYAEVLAERGRVPNNDDPLEL
jgi:glycosyltransferase involved in cell wall biosynthesis